MSNNHGITSVTPKVFKPVCNGKAVFPKVASLLNHSCNPNTSVVVQKDVQITYATKTIYPGEEICHIYNNHFADSPKDKRQAAMLKDYHFQCSCLACENNYELFENLPKDFDNDEQKVDLVTNYQFFFLPHYFCEFYNSLMKDSMCHQFYPSKPFHG